MVAPGDPELAADLARRAASVSHDGEAIYAAQVIASMEAQAFVEPDLDRLLEVAMSLIPHVSLIYQLIADLREWRTREKDWRQARKMLAERYVYDQYPGNCHDVPLANAVALIDALAHQPIAPSEYEGWIINDQAEVIRRVYAESHPVQDIVEIPGRRHPS